MGLSQVLPSPEATQGYQRRGWVQSSVPAGRCQSLGGPEQGVLLQYDWYTKVTSVVVDVMPRQLGGKGCVFGWMQ